jgi:hypothetical protein
MIDDYCQEHGQNGVIEAVNRFIELGVLEKVQIHKSEDRGWVLAYRSASVMPPSDFDLSTASIDSVLRDTESHYTQAQAQG